MEYDQGQKNTYKRRNSITSAGSGSAKNALGVYVSVNTETIGNKTQKQDTWKAPECFNPFTYGKTKDQLFSSPQQQADRRCDIKDDHGNYIRQFSFR